MHIHNFTKSRIKFSSKVSKNHQVSYVVVLIYDDMNKVFDIHVLKNKDLYLNQADASYKNLMAPILMNPSPRENSRINPMFHPSLVRGFKSSQKSISGTTQLNLSSDLWRKMFLPCQ